MAADIQVRNEGSIVQFVPLTPFGKQVLHNNVSTDPWQWLGDTLCVEWRYSEELALELSDLGVEICV